MGAMLYERGSASKSIAPMSKPSLAEPRLLGRGEGLGNCLYVTCSRGMFDCVTYNRTDITLRNARPHMNNTEPLDLPSELLRD